MKLNKSSVGGFLTKSILVFIILIWTMPVPALTQPQVPTDANMSLLTLKPDYPVPYGATTVNDIISVLDRIHKYLDGATPPAMVDPKSGKDVTNMDSLPDNAQLQNADFRLISYEWGVTYSGMLLAGEVTGDAKYTTYTVRRLRFIEDLIAKHKQGKSPAPKQLRRLLNPQALDHVGAMCTAMIKTQYTGLLDGLRPIIDSGIDFISNKEFRLPDGTLARNRPFSNTIWLDDLFMSAPALAQMGKLSGDVHYFDDAVKQVKQFADRMFVKEKGLFMHGWVQGMEPHPAFHWARANGWAVLAMVEVLETVPEDHPGRSDVLQLLRAHIRGLAACQSGTGFWHQLLDRSESYLETSATAIYTYAVARSINRGYVDAKAYGPMAMLAWNAVATRVNKTGQVEGTCVGTGMAFDPAYYYHRPTNSYAAHSYGPTLLAGAEMITLLKNHPFTTHDHAVMIGR